MSSNHCEFGFKDLNFYTIKAIPDRSMANLYGVIMISLQGVKKWSQKGFLYFLINY